MNLARLALKYRAVTYLFTAIVMLGGIGSFFSLGQLEDPDFTVKTAVVMTSYPGASPEEVELEVTDRIEQVIQELPEIDSLESYSRRGLSSITVNVKAEYWADRLPQVWNKLRSKIRDVEASLPPGVESPNIFDDFGDVFGFQLALTGDGFSDAELEAYAKQMKKELSLVEGVARVDLWGDQQRAIYLDVTRQQLSKIGSSPQSYISVLNQQNMVVDGGSLNYKDKRYAIAPSGEFGSSKEISDLMVQPSGKDNLIESLTDGHNSGLVRLGDLAPVSEGYLEPSLNIMRYNGAPVIGVSITNAAGTNVVQVGQNIDARLSELVAELPVGLEIERVHWMSDIVDESVSGFLVNFGQAVLIVLVVITLGMGWRMAIIIGTALVATILGSFVIMAMLDIDLQRMSLGALIIALGMMVDNAIVVADGYVTKRKQGMSAEQAAIEAASQPSMPLLGATLIAVMAFYPIFASAEDAGEYCRTLFSVVGISLMFSWVISMTITPVQCVMQLKDIKADSDATETNDSKFFRSYKALLRGAINARWITVGSMVSLLVVAVISFGNVQQLFFGDSSMTKFRVDYWAPEGTRIETVSNQLKLAEAQLLGDARVDSVTSYIGSGPPRFYLPVDPEAPYQSYGQLVVNVKDINEIDGLMAELGPWLEVNFPDAEVPLRKYGVGPSFDWKVEVRISGPANADPATLRELGEEAAELVRQSELADITRTNWRQRTQVIIPEYDQKRARWVGISRDDVARTTKRAFDGTTIGIYREGDDLIPIIARNSAEARRHVGDLENIQLVPMLGTKAVPLSAVTDGIEMEWEDPMIWRWDRRRTITVQSNPIPGVTPNELRNDVLTAIESLEVPPGYKVEWGGDFEGTTDAQKSLTPGMIPAVIIIIFTIVMLFNAFRPLLVIMTIIPFTLVGITGGLLAFDTPFGFLALLGAMSLAGMMIKNAIVLLDEVNLNINERGQKPYDAVINAAVSRLSPVGLATATTVLGVIPLLQDIFWVGLAVTVMAGLTFGTVLTMIMVPTLYAIFYRVKKDEDPVSDSL